MTITNQRIFAAMDAYLSKQTPPPDDVEQQISGDLDLVRRCHAAVQKNRDDSTSMREFAEQVVFDVLPWYPEQLRKKIADHLLAGH